MRYYLLFLILSTGISFCTLGESSLIFYLFFYYWTYSPELIFYVSFIQFIQCRVFLPSSTVWKIWRRLLFITCNYLLMFSVCNREVCWFSYCHITLSLSSWNCSYLSVRALNLSKLARTLLLLFCIYNCILSTYPAFGVIISYLTGIMFLQGCFACKGNL